MKFFVSAFICSMLALFALPAYGQDANSGEQVAGACGQADNVGNNLDQAIEALRTLLKSNPALFECRIRLGYLLLKKAQSDEAKDEFEAVLRQVPGSFSAKIGKGIALAQKGDLEAAETVLKDAVVLNPDPVKAHYELGLVYERMGKLENALSEFRAGINKYESGRK